MRDASLTDKYRAGGYSEFMIIEYLRSRDSIADAIGILNDLAKV